MLWDAITNEIIIRDNGSGKVQRQAKAQNIDIPAEKLLLDDINQRTVTRTEYGWLVEDYPMSHHDQPLPTYGQNKSGLEPCGQWLSLIRPT